MADFRRSPGIAIGHRAARPHPIAKLVHFKTP